MNLKSLNQTELDSRIKILANKERELLHEILLTLKEIDRRRLYLDLGYGSLFSYLTESVGYSAGSAQRRIDAARLLGEIPELGEKISSGALTLNQISLLQRASREVQKKTSIKVRPEQKHELLERLTYKNREDSEKTVAEFFDLPVLQTPKKHHQADDSVRVELTLPKELYAKIKEAQGLLSHSLLSQDLVKYLEHLTDRVLQAKKGKPTNPPTATVAVKNFSVRTQKDLFSKQQCCQYVDPITKKQCGTKWFLQLDHKHSRWAGGSNAPENAQLLCSGHNHQKYRTEAGVRYV